MLGMPVLKQELFGVELHLVQDLNSEELGTRVWDASVALAKFLEQNASHGEFSREKVSGKRIIELGSGMGLGGLAFALLGCKEVVLTDVNSVLPLLMKNVEANLPTMRLKGVPRNHESCVVRVEELSWGAAGHCASSGEPFDIILACDCVYHEYHIPDLLASIMNLSTTSTTVLMANELRSRDVHEKFIEQFSQHFTIERVSSSLMHPIYQHPALGMYCMKKKSSPETSMEKMSNAQVFPDTADTSEPLATSADHFVRDVAECSIHCEDFNHISTSPAQAIERELWDWKTRRLGSAAAQLLKNIGVPHR